MEYMLFIYETAMDFAARTNETGETFRGAWRAYHKAMSTLASMSAGVRCTRARPVPRSG
jgi:hypothetical protein